MLFFNTDTFDVGPNYNKLAEMYIRIKPDETTHVRVVYSFYDWLGSIGGINFVLTSFVKDIIGGYLYFNMIIEMMLPLFSFTKAQKRANAQSKYGKELSWGTVDREVDFTKFQIGCCERFRIYLINAFCCAGCCKRESKSLARTMDKLEEGEALMLHNFNLRNII